MVEGALDLQGNVTLKDANNPQPSAAFSFVGFGFVFVLYFQPFFLFLIISGFCVCVFFVNFSLYIQFYTRQDTGFVVSFLFYCLSN